MNKNIYPHTYTYTLYIYDQKTIKLIKKQSRGGGSHSGGG